MTVQEIARRLGKSDLTIRRWIKAGKITATMVDNKWDIPESALDDISDDVSGINHDDGGDRAHLLDEIKFLRKQNEQLQEQLQEKDAATEESRQRQDTIILQLTRQVDQTHRLLEYRESAWWKRWFKSKRPPQDEISD